MVTIETKSAIIWVLVPNISIPSFIHLYTSITELWAKMLLLHFGSAHALPHDILRIIITFSYSTCISSFWQQHPYFFVHLKNVFSFWLIYTFNEMSYIVHPESFRSNAQIAIAFARRNRPRVNRSDEFACVCICVRLRSTACTCVRIYIYGYDKKFGGLYLHS